MFIALSRTASAYERRVAVALDAGTCVVRPALRDAVATRGTRITEDAPIRLRVRVDLRASGDVAVGIHGDGPHGPLAERHFVASSCADATDALGLVVALAGEESVEEPMTVAVVSVPAPESSDRVVDASPSAPALHELAIYAGALGTSLAQGQIGARVGGALEWRRSLLPWIEAAASTSFPHTIHGGAGGAAATWMTGRLAAAPVGMAVGRAFRTSIFGGLDVGALNMSGKGATRVETRTRPWIALAAGAKARWSVGDRLSVGLALAAVVPFTRDDFVIIRGGSVYRAPAVAAETAIFIGAHFP